MALARKRLGSEPNGEAKAIGDPRKLEGLDPMKMIHSLFFGLLSLAMSFVGVAFTVLKWAATELPRDVFGKVMKLKNEIGTAGNPLAALIAPRSHPFATAPPALA